MTDQTPGAGLAERVQQLVGGITPGSWQHYEGSHVVWSDRPSPPSPAVCVLCGPRSWNGQSKRDAERVANGAFIAAAPDLIRDLAARLAALEARASTLEDAAFHFQTCSTCRRQGEDRCKSGRQFAAFLRGEHVER